LLRCADAIHQNESSLRVHTFQAVKRERREIGIGRREIEIGRRERKEERERNGEREERLG
jgi:hypothetical protein